MHLVMSRMVYALLVLLSIQGWISGHDLHAVPFPARKTKSVPEGSFRKVHPLSQLKSRRDLTLGSRAHGNTSHEVVFVRKQRNVDELERLLMEASDPLSPTYGRHLTKKEIASITEDRNAAISIMEFLRKHGAVVKKTTRFDDYISAQAPVSLWEQVFNTQFFEISKKGSTNGKILRCLQYTIPVELADHVEAVFNTVQLPDHHWGHRLQFQPASSTTSQFRTQASNSVTPSLLNSYYNIQNNSGNSLTNQAVYAILDQTLSPSDLSKFQTIFNLPREGIADNVGGHVSNNACIPSMDDCIEANLDVQYIMAVAQHVPTTYYYWTGRDVWLDWIMTVADMDDPPDVFTISYGSYESAFHTVYLRAFDVEAMKLGLAGTTILAASGDDGVAGFLARDGTVPCGYFASFPASSPYVTAVGGTMGPESNSAEVACQSNRGSSITTGGGMSYYHPVPSWQAVQVSGYYARVLGTSNQPAAGYDPTKRSYPDISIMANNYVVVANGGTYHVSGTSASSPVMAGMVSLVNAARRANGNSTLGFLNPALYALHTRFIKDVTSGNNKCLIAGYGCCPQGFYATTGWDPVTGLGTPNFELFKAAMLDIDASAVVDEVAESGSKRWVVLSGYDELNCPSNDHREAQTGYPVGVCITEHDDSAAPVSSVRYTCNAELGQSYKFRYAGPNCNVSASLGYESIPLGCDNHETGDGVTRSVFARCMSGADLPLPPGAFVVERLYDVAGTCPNNRTSSFNAWRAGNCFDDSDGQSFRYSSALVAFVYNGTHCNDSRLASTQTLSTTCTPLQPDSHGAGHTTAMMADSDGKGKFLGMGFTTALAIGIVIVCVILAVSSYACCRNRKNSATASTPVVNAATSRDPIVRTIARADAGPEFEIVPVAVAYPEAPPPDHRTTGRAYMA